MTLKEKILEWKADGLEIQSVIFSKKKGDWTLEKAKSWLEEHDFKNDKVDENEQSWRFRQFEPSLCDAETYVTLTEDLPEGVSAAACKKKKSADAIRSDIKSLIAYLKERETAGKMTCTEFRVRKILQKDGTEKEQVIIRKSKAFDDVEIKELGPHVYLHPISDGEIDRDGDFVVPSGMNDKNYRSNPVVMYGHDYYELPIAQNRKLEMKNGTIYAETEFDSEDPFASRVEGKYKRGVMRGWSVAFIPLRWEEHSNKETGKHGMKWLEWEMVEYSAVPIPSNPRAVASFAKSLKWEIDMLKSKKISEELLDDICINPIEFDASLHESLEKIYGKNFQISEIDNQLREGRVLSSKNRKLIQECVTQMQEAIKALNDLLDATDTTDEKNDKSGKYGALFDERPGESDGLAELKMLRSMRKLNFMMERRKKK